MICKGKGRDHGPAFPVQEYSHTAGISTLVKYIIHTGFPVHPDFDGIPKALGVDLYETILYGFFSLISILDVQRMRIRGIQIFVEGCVGLGVIGSNEERADAEGHKGQ